MAIELVDLAIRQRLGNVNEKLVLIAFANHVGEDGLSYPSMDLIAQEVEMSKRTVQRITKSFVDRGLLQIHTIGRGRGRTTRYRVCPEAIGRAPEYFELRESAGEEGLKGDTVVSPFSHPDDEKLSTKGDRAVSPFSERKGDKSSLKGDKSALKGDRAVSPEPRTYNHKAESYPQAGRSPPSARNSKSESADAKSLHQAAMRIGIPRQGDGENISVFRSRVRQADSEQVALANDARRLGLEQQRENESLESFTRRVNDGVFKQRTMDLGQKKGASG